MKSLRNVWFLLVLIACAGIGIGSYSLGRESMEKVMRSERDFDIMLNRSELEKLNLTDGPIYVFGHKSPDSDTV